MEAWKCALLVTVAGSLGGMVNALLTDNGFAFPQIKRGILCPGFLGNTLVGAFASFSSWAFYGSGAGVAVNQLKPIDVHYPALAGAFLVGVVGAKWISNEADKRLLKESIKVVNQKGLSAEECDHLVQKTPRQILDKMEGA